MKRRPFLLSTAAATFGAHLGANLARGQEPPGRKLGWALVGLGSLSTNQIAPALQKTSHSRLAAIVTGTPAKAAKWKEQYGIPDTHIYNYETFDRIADNPDVDVVYVVLPNSMHAEYTIRAAKAGKHVFCEKPMANSVAECRDMIAACEKAGKKLGIGYRCQFEPHHVEAMRFAREKTFGALRHIDAGFGFKIGDPSQWRLRKDLAGGGPLMDVGIYALQACRYLAGEEPTVVTALETKTDPEKFAEVEENLVWSMTFPSGLTANCQTSYALRGVNGFTAFADDGRFGIRGAFGYSGQQGWTSRDAVPLAFDPTDHFQLEMDVFSRAILEDQPFGPDGMEGLRDLQVIEAIYQAAKDGKAVEVAV